MQDIALLFKALADEARLRILNILIRSGELCVCDIEAIMGFTQTKVSRHLGYLKRAGLVQDRREGLWMLYSIAKPKDDQHKKILAILKEILASHPVAGRDTKMLAKNIHKGCCATFTEIKPNQIPAILELN
jgi:ArsR family transcriptional regulator